MAARLTSDIRLRLVLASTSRDAGLAADTLAAHLGLGRDEAIRRLVRAPAVLASGLDAARAGRLVPLLRLLGLGVRVEPEGLDKTEARTLSLAVQAIGQFGAVVPDLAARLGRGKAEVAQGLSLPGGMVFERLTLAEARAMRRRLRDVDGLRVILSDAETAVHDLLPWHRPTDLQEPPRLARHLRRLGLGLVPCRLTGAVAAQIDGAMCRHILGRFPRSGLLALDRAFQRFDLLLTDTEGVSPREAADFLTTRLHRPLATLDRDSAAAPLRIEAGLGREEVLRFQADYAAIGFRTRAVLVSGRAGPLLP